MPSLASPQPSEQPLSAITAESATLPIIRAAGFEARVNAYVVGVTERLRRRAPGPALSQRADQQASATSMSPGCAGGATDLWYLSLVAPRGHGTTLRAIWANLVGATHHAVWLEGVGMVTLGHQRLDLSGSASGSGRIGSGGLGYPIHWTYRQAPVPPSRDVQAVLESDLLTCYDPLLAPDVARAPRAERRKSSAQRPSAHACADRGSITLTSSTSASDVQEDETRAREARPLFLLLARSAAEGEQDGVASLGERWLARLHLRYLAARIPWLPYYPAWAEYLWRRALAQGEAEPLAAWSYGAAGDDGGATSLPARHAEYVLLGDADALTTQSAPYLAAAYLCRPDPLALTADLSRAIAAGQFNPARSDDAIPRAA